MPRRLRTTEEEARIRVGNAERERDGGNKNGDKESTQRGGEKGKLREQTPRPMEGDGRRGGRGGRTKHVYRVSKMFARGIGRAPVNFLAPGRK